MQEVSQSFTLFSAFKRKGRYHGGLNRRSVLSGQLLLWYLSSFQAEIEWRPAGARRFGLLLPEDGVMDAIGVAMMLLGLRAASCCICTAATVATGER